MEHNLLGKRFGRWTVLTNPEKRKNQLYSLCRCDCGTEKEVNAYSLVAGRTQSCGCLIVEATIERSTTHGHSPIKGPSRTYRSWYAMKNRCYNPNQHNYASYGGRGIKVCDRWLESFDNFLADMGERPEGKTLDRREADKDYTPENCKWSTGEEQAANRQDSIRVFYEGKTMPLASLADLLNLDRKTLRYHFKDRGLPLDVAIEKARKTKARNARCSTS